MEKEKQNFEDIVGRLGIKGRVKQLKITVPLLVRILKDLEESTQFSIEIHLKNGEIDEDTQRETIVKEFNEIAKQYQQQTNYKFSSIKIHVPFEFKGKHFNLATFDQEIWSNSLDLIKKLLEMAEKIEKETKISTKIVIHGYSLDYFLGSQEKLYEINFCHSLDRIFNALNSFSLIEREKIGIENTGTGPCSTPQNLVDLASKLKCFVVQDVAHLLRRFYVDENGVMYEREYNDSKNLIGGIKKMLHYTKHWHICQHHGGWKHDDWHLAMPGIINWPEIIPYILNNLKENDATAIIEVESMNYDRPIESFGSFLLFRQMIRKAQSLRCNIASER